MSGRQADLRRILGQYRHGPRLKKRGLAEEAVIGQAPKIRLEETV
jgi:hypothetical protein